MLAFAPVRLQCAQWRRAARTARGPSGSRLLHSESRVDRLLPMVLSRRMSRKLQGLFHAVFSILQSRGADWLANRPHYSLAQGIRARDPPSLSRFTTSTPPCELKTSAGVSPMGNPDHLAAGSERFHRVAESLHSDTYI